MWAFGLDFDERRTGEIELPDPGEPGPGQVRFRVTEGGVCGTDREMAAFRRGRPPEGESVLALGHEALGVVEAAGSGTNLKRGDWVVPMIRRACSDLCPSCRRSRRDLCVTGRYNERGIFGEHGYMAEWALDAEEDLILIPSHLTEIAILVEPLSVVEKAICTALSFHRGEPRTALVLGAGPVGILAALVLRLRGLSVRVRSLEPQDHPNVRFLRSVEIEYSAQARAVAADIVIEATGAPAAGFEAVASLAPLGVCSIVGARNGEGRMPFLDMIVGNHVVFGTVNASPEDFRQAVLDLAELPAAGMIERRGRNSILETLTARDGSGLKVVHRIEP